MHANMWKVGAREEMVTSVSHALVCSTMVSTGLGI